MLPLFEWPEQERYEQIRPLVLFDVAVAERAAEVGTSASTLYRRLDRFAEEGMESLFDTSTAKRRRLPPPIRRLIVDLKAEYPAFKLNEIANIVHACLGRRPDYRSVARVLNEEPVPLKIVRNYPPYHEARDVREARAAIVELRLSGWSAKAIAGYLRVDRATVYRTMKRWEAGGLEGLGNRPFGRHAGVRKADLWLLERTLTVEHAGRPLSAYEVDYDPPGGGRGGRLLWVGGPTLFETPFAPNQMRLFGLAETLGDDGWLRALRLEDYAPRRSRHPEMLQQTLFAYTDAI